MKTRIQLLLACFLISTAIIAQENVGIGTTNPDPSAKLEILSTDQGLLIPRMNTTQMNDISNPATGLLVFNTEKNALYAYDGVKWQILANLPNGNYNDFLRLDENQMPVWKPLLDQALLPEAKLTWLSGFPLGSIPMKLVVQNERAYVIDRGSDDLKVIDISDRSNPSLLGSIALGPYPEGLAVSGNYAFVTDRDSNDLKVIDMSNLDSLEVIDSFGVGDFTLELAVSGHYLYAVDRTARTLTVYDISNISSITPVYVSGAIFIDPLELKQSGKYLYVEGGGRLVTIDISNPLAPQVIGNAALGNGADRISEVINNRIVITNYQTDLVRWYDISNPASPVLLSTFDKGDFTLESANSPNYSVTHDWGTDLLYLFDHSNPSNPILIDSAANTQHGPTLMMGNYLYVAGPNSLSIFQIGNTQPLSVDPNGNFVATPPSPEIWQTNGNTYFVDATKKIGIGTQFPDFALEIGSGSTDLGATLQLSNLDRTHFLRIFGGHTNDTNSWINWKQGNSLIFSTANSDFTGWSEKMRITPDGKLGLGTSIVDANLPVSSGGIDAGATFQLNNLDRSNFIRIFSGHSNDPVTWFNWQDGTPLIFSTANDDFSDWSEKMRIDTTGYIGIGETSPDNPFHVKGAGGQGVHIAKIENTDPNGSGLEIQINGNHSMLISAPNCSPSRCPCRWKRLPNPSSKM